MGLTWSRMPVTPLDEMPLPDHPFLDPALYRDGMARYAGHVQVVTTEFEGVRRGVTVTAACSVSDNPPTLLACLNSSNANNAIFGKSGIFALNSLAAHHEALATAFAGLSGVPAEERFTLGTWTTLATGAPVLADAVVSFDCRLTDIKQVSTHFVMFGEVKAIHFGEARPSLIYLDRGFRTL
ncbi:cob(II)yrinic acid a,c-diamide reductase [Xaviernesmea oryzae]|uniref:Cob(II)yrinic acid a,c-diamide reductase n=2 Tax=Xaviernesmea oryzae TaxID=464029 RepID=A0A1X7GFU8_9HYPH|nr:cob(II)yrinic acid a,c-diamide reductase [Xaviernesmea oryzae]